MKKEKIIIVSSYSKSLINFRIDLILDLIKNNYDVYCVAPEEDDEVFNVLKNINVSYYSLNLERNGFSIGKDLNYCYRLFFLIKKIKPNLILSYTIKPVIFSNIVSLFFLGKVKSFSLITGLGFYGNPKKTKKEKLAHNVITILYKIAFLRVKGLAFQNNDDIQFLKANNIKLPSNVIVTSGSGINLERFRFQEIIETENVNFLLIARMLISKGVEDFLNAANILKDRFGNEVSFTIVGSEDLNSKDAVDLNLITKMQLTGKVEYFKNQKDVRPFLKKCSIFVLPSYYREGVPRTLLEALSVGRGIITTDSVGCRETVKDKKNGFLIAPKDKTSLIENMEKFINNKKLIKEFSFESRKYAVERFDVEKVNKEILKMIN